MTYEEIKNLVSEYGSNCVDLGDYQSRENAKLVKESYNKLLEEIKKLFDKLDKE